MCIKSCYRGQREGKTEEYKITNTKNCHNNAPKQKEPAIKSKYIIITKETIYYNPPKNLSFRYILLTTLSCSKALLGAGFTVPASNKLAVVLLKKLPVTNIKKLNPDVLSNRFLTLNAF